MFGGFAITAACRVTAKTPQHVTEGKAGRETVHCAKGGHAMAAHIPRAHQQRRDQPAGKHASGLQRVETENLPPVSRVVLPLIHDEQDLGAKNTCQNHENAEVPGVVAINTLLLGIADTDPKPNQDAGCDQQAISRQAEMTNAEESRKHGKLDAPLEDDAEESLAGSSC